MATAATKTTSLPGLDALRARDQRWYLPENETDRARKLTAVAASIRKGDRSRQENYQRYWSLYSNLPLLGLTPRRYTQTQTNLSRDRLALNVVRSCADSFVAKLTNQRPRASCVTSGGDWDLQQRAEMLETFLDGQFYETDLYETAPLVALDMAVLGTGTIKIYSEGEGENERIVLERVMPWETAVDDEEAYGGARYARSRYQRKYVDRLVAIALYAAEDEELARQLAQIARASEGEHDGQGGISTLTDTICIDEGWHLPSRAGSNDGRHTIACGDILIFDEPWNKSYFPFVDLYRQKPQSGIWGVGLAEELQGLQFEINVILNMIRKAMRMSGTLRWMIPNGSNINTQYISDLIGSMIRYDGQPPTPITPPAVAPEVYQHLIFLYGKAYEVTGVSQLSATSMAPANEESGKAKELRLDTESERFSVAFREYQLFFLKIARQVIALAHEVGKRNPKFRVKAVGKGKLMDVVQWADIHLDEEEYVLQLFPTNALARDPSARLQQVTDLVNAGMMDPRIARRMDIGIPDVEEEQSYEDASYNLTMQMVMGMLKRGEFQPPEPFMNLDESVKRVQLAYLKARQSSVPEERLDLLRRWIQMANDMRQPPAPPPGLPGPPGSPPGAGPTPGGPTPPSNANGGPPPAAAA